MTPIENSNKPNSTIAPGVETDPLHVIYVAGTSYSGSTILGAILAMHPDVESPGEIHAWVRDRSQRPLPESVNPNDVLPFWLQIRKDGLQGLPDASWKTFRELMSTFEGYGSAPVLMFQKLFFKTRPFQQYIAYTKSLLHAIARTSARRVIVDTSKRPFRLLALSMIDDVRLTCIHLVKSPSTYAESIRKRRLEEWVKAGKRADELDRQAANDWLWNNFLAEVAIWLSGARTLRIRYEDFAHAPAAVLGTVGSTTQIDFHSVAAHVENGGLIDTGHILGSGLVKKGPQPFTKKPPYRHRELQTSGFQKWMLNFFERRYGYR